MRYVRALSVLLVLFLTSVVGMEASFVAAQTAPSDAPSILEPSVADSLTIAAVMDTVSVSADSTFIEDVHPQDSPEERGFLIVTSDGRSRLRFRASIRLDGALDINGLQGQDHFDTYAIPVGSNGVEPRFKMDATQSRFGLEATTFSELGETFMRVEGDFRGSDGTFRLRHAYGSNSGFTLGQTWTTFSDVGAQPATVDFEGTNSSVSERTPQIRLTRKMTEDWRWGVSVEAPKPGISKPDSLDDAYQSYPDLIGRVRNMGQWGHLQVAGVVRSIAVKDSSSNVQYLIGKGVLVTGVVPVSPRNDVLFSFLAGEGVSRFITALSTRDADAAFNPETGDFETVAAVGTYISVRHRWVESVDSYFTGGLTRLEKKSFLPGDTFHMSSYVSANIFWVASGGSRVGLEYTWGRREDADGRHGNANRLSFITYYDF